MNEFVKDMEMANGYITQLHTPAPDPNQPAGPTAEATAPLDISVFEAVQKEPGLKLVKEKRSIPAIVADHIDERPID